MENRREERVRRGERGEGEANPCGEQKGGESEARRGSEGRGGESWERHKGIEGDEGE